MQSSSTKPLHCRPSPPGGKALMRLEEFLLERGMTNRVRRWPRMRNLEMALGGPSPEKVAGVPKRRGQRQRMPRR